MPTTILDQVEVSPGVFYIKLPHLDKIIPGQLIALAYSPERDVRITALPRE